MPRSTTDSAPHSVRLPSRRPTARARRLRRTRADSEWLEIDWREHLRTVDVVGARVNYVEMGEGPPLLFVHGLSGCWQNWLENIPHFARTTGSIALDLPGLRRVRCRPGRSRSRPTAVSSTTSASGSGSSAARWSATRWAASSPPRWRSPIPSRVDELVLVSAAGHHLGAARREPAAVLGADGPGGRAGPLAVPDGWDQAASACARATSRGSSSTRMRIRPRDALGERRPGAAEPRATTTR